MKKNRCGSIVSFLSFLSLLSFLTFADSDSAKIMETLEKDKLWVRTYAIKSKDVIAMDFRVWYTQNPEKVFRMLMDTVRLGKELTSYKVARTLSKEQYQTLQNHCPANAVEGLQKISDYVASSDKNRRPDQGWTDYTFYEFNFPWPITNRWAVQKAKVDETNADIGAYRYEYNTVCGNFRTLEGQWEVVSVPQHPGWAEFRGHYETNPGLLVPNGVIESAAKVGLKKDVVVHRKLLSGGQ